MTIDISNNDPRISYSVAQGVTQTSFVVPFEFFDDSDVNVYVDGTLKTITTDYTITGGGGSTGTVNISVTGGVGGSTVVLTRDITIERTTDFTAGADINRAALNTQLDTLTAIAADIKDKTTLALRYNDQTVGVSTEMPIVETLKGNVLAFNVTTGAPEAGPSITQVTTAQTSAINAAASATAAASSASSASTSETNAATSASNAATSASNASASETAAGASETAAATSATSAASSASSASSSASAAAASESAAATSETNAAASESAVAASASSAASSATTASTAATNAGTSETNAASSATAAAASAAAAAVSESNAATSETNAATSATSASTSASNASTSESNAATSETNAATSETNAASSATAAASSATSASTSASNAASSETNAASSAAAASASQTSAAASAAAAANSYDLFDDRYLGSKTSDPTLDNDGNALVAGALYFNSTANEMRVYDGANWIAATSAGNASLLEYKYTATSSQTTFSGSDDNANSLSYTQDNIIVTLNGVVLENGTDYTATTGTSIVLASGAALNDEINIIAFKSFTTADMVAASTGGVFYGNVDFSAGIDVTGNITVTGTVDGRDLATDGTKLDGIEALADVTDATNVTAAGALMDSELTSEASVKALNQGVATTDSPTFVTLNATTVDLGNWTVTESAGVLYFATGGTNKMKLDASGNLTVTGDVTAYGTV